MELIIPEPIERAIDHGIQFIMGENCEWKLEIDKTNKWVSEFANSPVLIFANNGYNSLIKMPKQACWWNRIPE